MNNQCISNNKKTTCASSYPATSPDIPAPIMITFLGCRILVLVGTFRWSVFSTFVVLLVSIVQAIVTDVEKKWFESVVLLYWGQTVSRSRAWFNILGRNGSMAPEVTRKPIRFIISPETFHNFFHF